MRFFTFEILDSKDEKCKFFHIEIFVLSQSVFNPAMNFYYHKEVMGKIASQINKLLFDIVKKVAYVVMCIQAVIYHTQYKSKNKKKNTTTTKPKTKAVTITELVFVFLRKVGTAAMTNL